MTDLVEWKKQKFYEEAFKDIQEWIEFLRYIKVNKPDVKPPTFEKYTEAKTKQFKQSLEI